MLIFDQKILEVAIVLLSKLQNVTLNEKLNFKVLFYISQEYENVSFGLLYVVYMSNALCLYLIWGLL